LYIHLLKNKFNKLKIIFKNLFKKKEKKLIKLFFLIIKLKLTTFKNLIIEKYNYNSFLFLSFHFLNERLHNSFNYEKYFYIFNKKKINYYFL